MPSLAAHEHEKPLPRRQAPVLRLVSLVLLLGLCDGLLVDLYAPGQAAMSSSTMAAHGHADDCPDPEPSGDPCGPGCHCTCCPGHALATLPAPTLHQGVADPGLPGIALPMLACLHPRDHHVRVFRPPSA